jgi:nudix-type nucleoside diphosphatase (YffH/AdpP family)
MSNPLRRRTGTATISGRERLHDGFVKLDVYDVDIVQDGRRARVRREVHDHGHGAAVLPVDAERRTALLVRQHRLPVAVSGIGGIGGIGGFGGFGGEPDGGGGDGGFLIEACAGLIDPGDADAAAAILREAREELGYVLHDLEEVALVFTCPGVLTETIACFLAHYGAADRIRDEGGGVDADELIEVEEWRLADLEAACAAGAIHDAKTMLLAQALRLRHPELFD